MPTPDPVPPPVAEPALRHAAGGAIATGVAHQLRGPLLAIASATQLLRFRAREDPVMEKNVGRVLREVDHLNRLMTALLEYGRAEPARLEPADPDGVWDTVLEANRGLLESKSLVLHRTRAMPPASCRLDRDELARVFGHLLVNAVDAAPEATDLALRSETLPDGGWRAVLRDDGPTVPPETLARAFELFFTTRAGGTGLGLALCERLIAAHGGTIALESAAGAGTTATVTLPGA